jgi:hypothetical protein
MGRLFESFGNHERDGLALMIHNAVRPFASFASMIATASSEVCISVREAAARE